jgi:alginate O-acetyltransferase complex protein AlgI
MFPQLIAGPIVSYHTISDQLHDRKVSMAAVESGLRTFTVGLGMKVLLANRIGNLWTDVYGIGYESISTPLAWLAAAAYSMQIYFDFYGYSLMAIGLGEMLGFKLPDNFRHPYMAVSMTGFWRRWHMTLSSWFRDYVYIPLGGNRVGFARMIFNLFVVWLLTGLWHGASWNFVLWGMVTFLFLMLEKWFLYPFLEKHRLIGHLYMCLLILVTWSIFAITDFGELATFFERLFPFASGQSAGTFATDFLKYLKMYGVTMGIGLVFCTDYPAKWFQRHRSKAWMAIGLLAVFWGSVYYLYLGLDNPFLYFRF